MGASDLLTKGGLHAIRLGLGAPGAGAIQKYLDNFYFSDLLKRLRIDCLLDVGANTGQFGAKVRAMGYTGHIFSFEPIPADAEATRIRAADDPRWHVHTVALGDEDGEKQFNVFGPGHTVLSSFLDPSLDEMPTDSEKITVQIRRLDNMFEEIIRIAGPAARVFLKMDTQGYDLEVAKGCVKHMDRVLGLQSELSVFELYANQPRYTAAIEYYEACKFSLMNLAIVNRRPQGNVLEYDALFARIDELAV